MLIEKTGASIKAVDREEIPPDPANMITALRQIGYTLEQSLADLIDNSINAKASHVLVRLIHDGERIVRVLIADNGSGMNDTKLREAMKFGSEQKNDGKSLGKYGMGLKVASLGYAQTLTVLTRQQKYVGGRRWTVDGISDGWVCDMLDSSEVEKTLEQPLGNVDLSRKGTLLIWSDIDRLTVEKGGLAKTIQKITKKLKLHFGVCFHRFIEDERLEIRIDDRAVGSDETDICQIVTPINPFKYDASGDDQYPKLFETDVPGVGPLRVDAHIWPPNSKSLEYKLGGKAAEAQGFYFYRNDRLIQTGGWNGVLDSQTDPHNSLARIVINMDPNQDAQYGLNVQKSAIIVPTAFTDAMKAATASDRSTFSEYRSTAMSVYRKDDRYDASMPLVPNSGIPKRLAATVRDLIKGDKGRVRKVDIEWGQVKSGDIFELDRNDKRIVLNEAYRDDLLGGWRKSKTDIPVFKLLLFLLTEADLDNSRVTAKQKERLDLINAILKKAASLGRG